MTAENLAPQNITTKSGLPVRNREGTHRPGGVQQPAASEPAGDGTANNTRVKTNRDNLLFIQCVEDLDIPDILIL